MTNNNIDLEYYFKLRMTMFNYHEETNGRPFRKNKPTKPYINYLKSIEQEDLIKWILQKYNEYETKK